MSQSSDLGLLRRALPLLRQDAPLFLFSLLLAPITAGTVVLQPYLMKVAIDEHIATGDLDGLHQLAWLYLGAVVVGFVAEAGYTLTLSYAAMGTIARLRERVYGHALGLSRSWYDKEPTGRLLTRVTSDVEALGETLTAGAVSIVVDVLQVLGVLAAMFWLNAGLTLVLIVASPPLLILIEVLRRVLRRLYTEIRTSLSELNAFLSERLTGIEAIQLASHEDRTLEAFDERLGRYRSATIRTNLWDAFLYATIDGLSAVAMALMLWYGASGILDATLTAGVLAAFIDYVGRLFRPIQEFSAKLAVLQRASAALQKIFSLLDVDERIEGDAPVVPGPGAITLSEVGFAYGDGPAVLHGLDLDVAPGEVIALVGRTGSGKTTVGKLLTRAYQGYTGSIRLDGVELATLKPEAVRRTVGVVRQDVQLFPGDVRFNLALGRDIPDERLDAAIDAAQARALVDRLGGLDGRVEQDGLNLSTGEAQLLSFARTIAHDPPVVILDEATASVDTLTEARIQQATEAILKGRTVLVIAHRLSTITHADRIAVLDGGRLIEIGPHRELLAQGGRYAQLFRQQFEAMGDHSS